MPSFIRRNRRAKHATVAVASALTFIGEASKPSSFASLGSAGAAAYNSGLVVGARGSGNTQQEQLSVGFNPLTTTKGTGRPFLKKFLGGTLFQTPNRRFQNKPYKRPVVRQEADVQPIELPEETEHTTKGTKLAAANTRPIPKSILVLPHGTIFDKVSRFESLQNGAGNNLPDKQTLLKVAFGKGSAAVEPVTDGIEPAAVTDETAVKPDGALTQFFEQIIHGLPASSQLESGEAQQESGNTDFYQGCGVNGATGNFLDNVNDDKNSSSDSSSRTTITTRPSEEIVVKDAAARRKQWEAPPSSIGGSSENKPSIRFSQSNLRSVSERQDYVEPVSLERRLELLLDRQRNLGLTSREQSELSEVRKSIRIRDDLQKIQSICQSVAQRQGLASLG